MTAVRGSTLDAIGAIHVRDAGGLSLIAAGRVRDATGLHAFFGTLAVNVDPTTVRGGVNSSGSPAVQTQITTATPTGGTAPYTYLWERTDAGADDWEIASPTSAATRFVAQGVGPDTSANGTFACTVTDAHGLEATSDDVSAISTNFSTLGGGPLP